jgi:uncharacterized protein YhfF
VESFRFGDSAKLADELLALVLAGRKTATCWAERDGQQTAVGKRMIVRDGADRARAIVETLTLDRRRFCDVDAAFAAAEGEGDLSLEYWRQAHADYFSRNGGYTTDMMLWCECFRLVEVIAI